MEPELSTTMPMDTGMSSWRNEVMFCGCPFSYTVKAFCWRLLSRGRTSRLRQKMGRQAQKHYKKKIAIPSAHNNPFSRKPGAAAIPSAEGVSLLSYAICRLALGSLDGIRAGIGCATQYLFSLRRPRGHSGYQS